MTQQRNNEVITLKFELFVLFKPFKLQSIEWNYLSSEMLLINSRNIGKLYIFIYVGIARVSLCC